MTARREVLFPATVLFAAAALAWLYHDEIPLRSGVVFHHMASVRELAKGELPPAHNLVKGPVPQAHYGPYLVALGFAARLTGAEPLAVLQAAGLTLLVAFLFTFRAVAARLVSPETARVSPLAALLLWGPWPGRELAWVAWGWPGTTSLGDPWNFFYPQHAAIVLLLAVLALVLDRPVPLRRAALAAFLSALLVATHPFTAMAFALALACLALAELLRREAAARRVALLLGLPLLGLLLAGLWPYYPVLKLLGAFVVPYFRAPLPPAPAFSGAGAVAGEAARAAAEPLVAAGLWALAVPAWHVLGPALLGLVWAAHLARRGRPFLLLWGFAALLVSVTPLVPLRQRLLTFAALPLQLAAAGLLDAGFRRGGLRRAGALLLLLLGTISAAQRVAWLRTQEPIQLAFLAHLVPEDAVILSDERTSNAVAGLAGRKIVSPEGPDLFLIMAGGAARRLEVRAFLMPGTSAARRERILRHWEVTHVLVDRLGPAPLRLPYPVVYDDKGYTLYDVRGVVAGRVATP